MIGASISSWLDLSWPPHTILTKRPGERQRVGPTMQLSTDLVSIWRARAESYGRGEIHRKVIGDLKRLPSTSRLGLQLDRLRKKRVHADYLPHAFSRGEAQDSIELATEVVDGLPRG